MSIVERERVEEVVAPQIVTEADVLHRAADLLEEFGWSRVSQLSPLMGHGPTCLLGAIYLSHCDYGRQGGDPYSIAARYLGGEPARNHWIWNDAPGRTKAEVVAKLREAAEAARA